MKMTGIGSAPLIRSASLTTKTVREHSRWGEGRHRGWVPLLITTHLLTLTSGFTVTSLAKMAMLSLSSDAVLVPSTRAHWPSLQPSEMMAYRAHEFFYMMYRRESGDIHIERSEVRQWQRVAKSPNFVDIAPN